MKTIDEIISNYEEYETFVEDRFGKRFCEFLTIDQIDQIGFTTTNLNHKPKEWTYNNVLKQLKEDAEFGLEKAQDQRGISSSLMYDVCVSWCKIIEKEDLILDYASYGIETFENILEFIGDKI